MKLHRSAVVTAALTGALALPAIASADVVRVDGNPTCASLGAGLKTLKVEPVRSGDYRNSNLAVALRVSGTSVSFTTTGEGVDAVIVKGGPNANVYRYSPEVNSGSGLTTPTNPSSGQPYGLSHVSFCYDGDGTPPKGGDSKGGKQESKQQTSKKQHSKQDKGKVSPNLRGRMTGHGQQFNYGGLDKVQWEFRNSVCGQDRFPDLKVEFGTSRFVLETYSSPLRCAIQYGGGAEGKPVAGFDTIFGQGTGTLDGKPATIRFEFSDLGEPGRRDQAFFTIFDASGNTVLDYRGNAGDGGNHQAHRR